MSIEFTEIQDQMTPDIQIETDWESGIQGLPSTTKALLLVGSSANLNGEVHRATTLDDAIDKYGEGTILACMIEAALRTAPKATIYAMSIAAGATAAELEYTLAGTNTAPGVLKLWVGGRLLQVGFATGITAVNVEAAVVTAYGNEARNWPAAITQGIAPGDLNAGAVNTGIASNSIRFRVDVSKLPGITVAGAQTAEGFLVGGTTATSPATPLAAIQASRFHLLAMESGDAVAALAAQTHQVTQSSVSSKKWGMAIIPETGGSVAAQAQTLALDSFRSQVVALENSPRPAFELAAAFAAHRATKDPRQECDDDRLSWLMPPSDMSDWPTPADIEADLDLGVTPLECHVAGGKVTIPRSIVSAQPGTLAASMAQDATLHEKADYFDETIITRLSAYKGKTWKAAGNPGRPSTVTPDRALALFVGVVKDLDEEDYVQFTELYNSQGLFVAEANATNPDRVDLAGPFHPTRSAHLWAVKKTYTY